MVSRYTFRLKPDRDADLIVWLNSLGDGERSCFIRNALRLSLKSSIPHQSNSIQKESIKVTSSINQFQITNSMEPDSEETIKAKLDLLTQSF